MNRSDRRNYELHRAVVARLREQPAMVLGIALRNVERYRQTSGDHPVFCEWERLLRDGPDAVIEVLLDEGERGQRLRSSTPFAGVLSPQEHGDATRHSIQRRE
jgi:hypothetical protein